jgi:hypothetical protein
VNGNTQEFIQGIENVNHGTTWLLQHSSKYPNVDLGYRINFFGASSQLLLKHLL